MLFAPVSKSSFGPALARLALVALPALASAGCEKKSGELPAEPSAASAAASAPPAPTFRVAFGPRLAILAGQGIGPIRAGATVQTIERLMEHPCDEKTPTLCRYVNQAAEFELGADGKLVRIHLHRLGRAAGGGKTYGVFNGAIPPDIQLGMIMPAVQEYLGKPTSVEEGAKGAAPETVVQHHYQGMVLEYDRLPNGKIALGGIRIPD